MSMDLDTLFEFTRKIHQAGNLEGAVMGYADILKEDPSYPHANYLYGVSLVALSRPNEALPHLQTHLKARTDHAAGWVALGDCFNRQSKISESSSAYNEAIRLEPRNVNAAVGIGQLLLREKKWPELKGFAHSLLKVHRESLPVLGLFVRACEGLEEYKTGLMACVDFAVDRGFPDELKKWTEELFKMVPHPDEALIEKLKKIEAIKLRILCFRACLRAKRLKDALEVLEKIREEDPNYEELSLTFIADALQNAEFYGAAAPFHWELLAKNPNDDLRLIRLIENTLSYAKKNSPEQYADARELAKVLMDRSADSIECYSLMATTYMHASRPEMALPYFDKVIEMNPEHPTASPYLFTLNYDERRAPEEVFEAHMKWARRFESKIKPIGSLNKIDRSPDRPLKVGYLSPDLGHHPVGFFSIDVFKHHNPEEVEVFLYSNRFMEVGDDAISQKFRSYVDEDHWRWTRSLPTERLVELIQADGIDVLVDMAGHTGHNRLDALAARAAPVQVSWLGYANTTGLKEVDYRLSDAVVEPEGDADERSAEKIYRMPNGFHMFSVPQELPEVSEPPCLKRGYITFGSYNNMNKLGSKSVELWAKLLKRVPHSKILLKHKTLAVLDNRESLRSLFAMHGIQAQRVILKTTTPKMVDHFASYGEMDIALDPLAYNGTTTSCDALMMGVPILTLPGRTHASRVTASLLHRVGLDQWAPPSEEDYLNLGAMAAQNPTMLKEIRREIRSRFFKSPLGDGPAMAADLEQAYRHMWGEYCNASEKESPKESKQIAAVS